MSSRSPSRIVFLVTLGVAALIVCLWFFRPSLLNRYYLLRVSMADSAREQSNYIDALVERKCAAVVPYLLCRYVKRDDILRGEPLKKALASIASFGEDAIPYLARVIDKKWDSDRLLQRPYSDLSEWEAGLAVEIASETLVVLASAHDGAVEALIGGLARDWNVGMGRYVASATAHTRHPSVVRLIIPALLSEDENLRRNALLCLMEMEAFGEDTLQARVKEALPALCKILSSPDKLSVGRAIAVIWGLGADGVGALPCLEERLSSQDRVDARQSEVDPDLPDNNEIREALKETIDLLRQHADGSYEDLPKISGDH